MGRLSSLLQAPATMLIVATLTTWAAGTACNDNPELTTPPNGSTSGIGGGNPNGGADAMGGAGGAGGLGGATAVTEPVRLGVIANTASSSPTPGDRALAELTAFASGVRAVSVELAWHGIHAAAVADLADRVDDYVERDLAVVIDLLIVDGQADLRPDAVSAEAWNAQATKSALSASIAAVLSATEGDVAAVVLGRRVDAYLVDHPADQQALTELVSEGLGQLAAAGVAHGVGLTYAGPDLEESYRGLAALGDTTILAYLPGLGLDQVPVDVSHAKALDQMIALADGRPIHLHAAGFPSAAELGSSEAVQVQQLDGMFAALESRRSAFPLVVVKQLHDLDGDACSALVVAQGLDPGDPLGTHLCSTGLRDTSGEPKLAYARFLQAAAHFATP